MEPSSRVSRPSVWLHVSDCSVIRSLGLSPFAMAASLEPSASSPLITTAFNVGSIKKVGVAMTAWRERTASDGTWT